MSLGYIKKQKREILLIGLLLLIMTMIFFKVSKNEETGKIQLVPRRSALIVSQTKYIEPVNKDFAVVVPNVDINLPVSTDVDGFDKSQYLDALKTGVAHFKGTAKPGEQGNIFIFGHSSNWRWEDGNFKDAFKNLDNIKDSETISVWFQNKEYRYTVYEKKVVEADELSWLAPTEENILTLMTCYPIGTNEKRLIVRAKQI